MIFTFGKGTGGKGVYITVTCDPAYQGYNIICTTGSVSKSKTCGSNNTVKFSFSENEVSTLPATFTISNNHPDYSGMTQIETASMYGWYDTVLNSELILFTKDNPTVVTCDYDNRNTNAFCGTDTNGIKLRRTAQAYGGAGFYLKNKFNVSNINQIKFSISGNTPDLCVGLTNSIPTHNEIIRNDGTATPSYVLYQDIPQNTTTKIVFNCSSLTSGSYYLSVINGNKTNTLGRTGDIYISRIVGE